VTTQPKLLVDRPAPGVMRLLINRPDKRNAIDYDVRQAMIEALSALRTDGATRALVFGGVGGHFSAGGDVPSMLGLSEEQARSRMQHIAALCRLVGDVPLPVVTAMEGVSAGACVGLALLGDHIVVGEGARILFPFMKLGLVPDWGSLMTLPRRVGLPTALRLMSAAQPIGGAEALRCGLADELRSDGEVMAAAVAKAAELAQLPLAAYARMKQRLNTPSATLEEELRREEADQSALLRGADFAEGYAAFVEKRQPRFVR